MRELTHLTEETGGAHDKSTATAARQQHQRADMANKLVKKKLADAMVADDKLARWETHENDDGEPHGPSLRQEAKQSGSSAEDKNGGDVSEKHLQLGGTGHSAHAGSNTYKLGHQIV